MRTHPTATAIAIAVALALTVGAATAQATYLDRVASDPEATQGEARLLHYLAEDLPIEVHIEMPDRVDAAEVRERVAAAFTAWQDAAPDVAAFRFVDEPTEGTLRIRWQRFEDDRVGSYSYRYEVLASGAWRFWTAEVQLDPRHELDAMYRYALLEAGHALGLLGRSPFAGDAMSAVPSGQVTPRDVATLRALYDVPSGTVFRP
jgi:hypothetical protein